MSGRMRTHSMGVLCASCREELVSDECSCGSRHGHTFQEPNDWAALVWSDHACFDPPLCGCGARHWLHVDE